MHSEPEAVKILAEAAGMISADRRAAYGEAIDDFTHTAAIWTVILRRKGKLAPGVALDAHDVALFMAGLKLSREAHVRGRDNCVDGAGYFALANQVAP